MKRILPAILLFTYACCYGQKTHSKRVEKEVISEPIDSTIKKEIALFAFNNEVSLKIDSLRKQVLTEAPLTYCDDKTVHLNIGSTYISIRLKGENSDRSLDSIFLVTHSHFWVRIPRTTFNGLFQVATCTCSASKKTQSFSPDYKAFYSKRKERLYIYMRGGNGSKKYEVIWVIVRDRYYTRIMNEVP